MEESQLDVDKVVHYWLTTAADDLTAAEHLFQSGDYTHALFFAHLYLEKVLKAQVVQVTGEHAPISHNLRYLAQKGGLELSAEQLAFLARVTECAIKTRYPDMELQFKRQCTQEFCATELKEIKEFGTWTEKMVTS
ncbi:MAG: HEPN domain-containing protein [Anaerolineales bacterium]|nr:MAG: HEPN domain-containing protein [Anaerolineales bacterium]